MTAIRPKELRKPAGASGRPAAYCPQKSRPGGYAVGAQTFDFTKVFAADLPSPSGKWTGLAKFNFTGGNNDPPQIPLDELVAAANNVLRREGRNLAVYNLGTGPQGYVPLRDFIAAKLKRDAGMTCDR